MQLWPAEQKQPPPIGQGEVRAHTLLLLASENPQKSSWHQGTFFVFFQGEAENLAALLHERSGSAEVGEYRQPLYATAAAPWNPANFEQRN